MLLAAVFELTPSAPVRVCNALTLPAIVFVLLPKVAMVACIPVTVPLAGLPVRCEPSPKKADAVSDPVTTRFP